MLIIKFDNNSVYQAELESSLLELAKGIPEITIGCGKGVCGRCVMKVISGEQSLNKISELEEFTLSLFGIDSGEYRLACQCIVFGDVTFSNEVK